MQARTYRYKHTHTQTYKHITYTSSTHAHLRTHTHRIAYSVLCTVTDTRGRGTGLFYEAEVNSPTDMKEKNGHVLEVCEFVFKEVPHECGCLYCKPPFDHMGLLCVAAASGVIMLAYV